MALPSKITIATLRERKKEHRKISMLTCYDFAFARLLAEAELDSLLVGDTYAEVCLGHETTLPATMDHMVTLSAAVRRGAPRVYLIGDMPFLSYQVCPKEAIRNAGRFLVDGGCDGVKLEVDRRLRDTVASMAAAGIPVMAHLGLRPQSIQQLGGYRVQGRLADGAARIVEDARMMEDAGAVSLLLEAVPTEVAQLISESTELPVIGIASGPNCDGQVLVLHDMLGFGGGHPPRSVKQYASLHKPLVEAFRAYAKDVVDGHFPQADGGTPMNQAELDELYRRLGRNRSPKE